MERAPRAVLSIDWMLLVVGLIVLMVCIGAFIRIATEPQTLRQQFGFLALASADNLLAFEDFSFGAEDWSPDTTSNRLIGLGPVLGPFTHDPVERHFQLPTNTTTVRVSFDVHLHGTWAEGDALRVMMDDAIAVAMTLGLAQDGQLPVDVVLPGGAAVDVHASQSIILPRAPEPSLPSAGAADAIVTLHLSLRSAPSSDNLLLGLAAEASDGASWTLDNLAVVATTDGEP